MSEFKKYHIEESFSVGVAATVWARSEEEAIERVKKMLSTTCFHYPRVIQRYFLPSLSRLLTLIKIFMIRRWEIDIMQSN